MYHSRVSSTSWPLANSGSTSASGRQWKARSQAAYQGYSHLSGMEITSALLRWCQSSLRPVWRASGGGGWAGSPFSQRDVVVVELLAPDHAGEGLALDEPRVGVGDPVCRTCVELVGLGAQAVDDGVEIVEAARRAGAACSRVRTVT